MKKDLEGLADALIKMNEMSKGLYVKKMAQEFDLEDDTYSGDESESTVESKLIELFNAKEYEQAIELMDALGMGRNLSSLFKTPEELLKAYANSDERYLYVENPSSETEEYEWLSDVGPAVYLDADEGSKDLTWDPREHGLLFYKDGKYFTEEYYGDNPSFIVEYKFMHNYVDKFIEISKDDIVRAIVKDLTLDEANSSAQ